MGASALERHVGVEEVRWKEIRLLVPNQSHGHPFFNPLLTQGAQASTKGVIEKCNRTIVPR
jgi:hypothetical protein